MVLYHIEGSRVSLHALTNREVTLCTKKMIVRYMYAQMGGEAKGIMVLVWMLILQGSSASAAAMGRHHGDQPIYTCAVCSGWGTDLTDCGLPVTIGWAGHPWAMADPIPISLPIVVFWLDAVGHDKLWMSHPWKSSRPGWGPWSNGGCLCPQQGVGMRRSLSSIPTETIPWFYDSVVRNGTALAPTLPPSPHLSCPCCTPDTLRDISVYAKFLVHVCALDRSADSNTSERMSRCSFATEQPCMTTRWLPYGTISSRIFWRSPLCYQARSAVGYPSIPAASGRLLRFNTPAPPGFWGEVLRVHAGFHLMAAEPAATGAGRSESRSGYYWWRMADDEPSQQKGGSWEEYSAYLDNMDLDHLAIWIIIWIANVETISEKNWCPPACFLSWEAQIQGLLQEMKSPPL